MHVRFWSGLLGLAVLAGGLLLADRARADAIDGQWCFPDGRRFSIRGAEIVTPGGTRMRGDYSRHSFSYVVPAAEPKAGQTVYMILMNEMTVNLRIGHDAATAAEAPLQVWHRCETETSALSRAANAC